MNIIRINEAIFDQLNTDNECGYCWSFTYARKDYANLKNDDTCCVHAFIEKFRTSRVMDFTTGKLDYETHTYTIRILLDSLFDIQIFNELQPEDAKSKFADYVEPLLDCFPDAYEKEVCKQGLSMTSFSIEADYNKYDQNRDGIWCNVILRTT